MSTMYVGPFEVSTKTGEAGVPVVQISGAGRVQVDVNDATVFEQHTEENGRDANGNVGATVTDVAMALRNSDPATVLAKVFAAFALSTDAADFVDDLGRILGPVAEASNLPATDPDERNSVQFWSAVAVAGHVPHQSHEYDEWDD